MNKLQIISGFWKNNDIIEEHLCLILESGQLRWSSKSPNLYYLTLEWLCVCMKS